MREIVSSPCSKLICAAALGLLMLAIGAPSSTDAQTAPPNATTIPRAAGETKTQPANSEAAAAMGRVILVALLTDDGQRIDQGLVWRVFQDSGAAGKSRLVSTHREASPELRLPPGPYVINAAFGRANLTRKITVKAGGPATERFVLNAGGLKIDATLEGGDALPAGSVHFDVMSDERDQFGNRARIMSGARPGLIIRLNAGLYHVISTYGDANATVGADVTVEAGKLTNATVAHAAARVTFKLVPKAGGHAIADTQWSLQTLTGEPVKDSVGALPTHTLAPGNYAIIAKSGGQTFRRDFAVHAGDVVQVEVVMQ